jgi:hypothetical protein
MKWHVPLKEEDNNKDDGAHLKDFRQGLGISWVAPHVVVALLR